MLQDEFIKWNVHSSDFNVAINQDHQESNEIEVDDPFFELLSEVPVISSEKSEIEMYLGEALAPSSSDPLVFWKNNCNRFPVLSNIARKMLAIPASSAGVERVFSVTGCISRARRSKINAENVSRLLMVRENIDINSLGRQLGKFRSFF